MIVRKNILPLVFFLLLSIVLTGQSRQKFYLDEVCGSVNKMNLNDANTENIRGYGASLKHNLMADRWYNVLFGLEYNHTSVLKRNLVEASDAYATNVTYYLDYLTFPLSVRLNTGKRFKAFIEGGLYVELAMSAERDGTMHRYPPGQTTPYVYLFHDNTGVSLYSYGPSIGGGFRIPFLKHEIVVKSEYKYGLKPLVANAAPMYNRYFQFALGFKI